MFSERCYIVMFISRRKSRVFYLSARHMRATSRAKLRGSVNHLMPEFLKYNFGFLLPSVNFLNFARLKEITFVNLGIKCKKDKSKEYFLKSILNLFVHYWKTYRFIFLEIWQKND